MICIRLFYTKNRLFVRTSFAVIHGRSAFDKKIEIIIADFFRRELPVTSHPPFVTSGHGSAVAIVELMDRAAGRVDPAALVDTYAATPGGKSKAVTSVLWEAFGEGTIGTLCDGAVTLAMIWESAWKKGLGEQRFTSAEMVAINKNSLRAKYEKPSFVPSLDLDHIQPVLKGHP